MRFSTAIYLIILNSYSYDEKLPGKIKDFYLHSCDAALLAERMGATNNLCD
ncbi:hypothetical protein GCM10027442_52180 [Emticicia fontis]